mgnify:CR=1 FL=1
MNLFERKDYFISTSKQVLALAEEVDWNYHIFDRENIDMLDV